jgi:phenylacetic acid degradation operon negative regulatory protein
VVEKEQGDPQLPLARPSRLNSQALLVAVLADYSFSSAGEFPSAAIVDVMGEFGVSAAGARVALSRVAKGGTLVQLRHGRNTSYALNEEGLAQREARLRGYLRFGASGRAWDGKWTIVFFTIPEEDRGLRPRFRRELEKLRLASLADAVWVQPADVGEAVARIGAELGVGLAVVRGEFQHAELSRFQPMDAFDLDRMRAGYDDFVVEYEPWVERMLAGRVAPTQALVLRTNALAHWRDIVRVDPELPSELLPDDWPLNHARGVFLQLWEGLGDLALGRLRDIVGRHDPQLAAHLRLRVR